VYKHTAAFEVKENKISTVDSNDNLIVQGDKKGYVYVYYAQDYD